MKKTALAFGTTFIASVIFLGCNSNDTDVSGNGSNQTSSTTAQVYTATLGALNPNFTFSDTQTGTAAVTILGDRVDIVVNGTHVDPSMTHLASLQQGDHCPDAITGDLNGDGVIDAVEGESAYGLTLVELGANLDTLALAQSGGQPVSDSSGSFIYHGTGSYSSLLNDLHTRIAEPTGSGIGTLPANQSLDLSNSVIIVDGIDPSITLPSTTQTLTGMTAQQSLPILCGKLQLNTTAITLPSATPSPTPITTI